MELFATLFTLWVMGSAAWFYTEKALRLFRMRKAFKARSRSPEVENGKKS